MTLNGAKLNAVRAKVAAKKRWHAMQPSSELASPVCYLDEPPAALDLETFMNLAAMKILSGLPAWELEALKVNQPQRYAQLLEQARAVPHVYDEAGNENGVS